MAGILNKKDRLIDYKLTEHGRRQLMSGDIRFKYYTFSDRSIFYETNNIEGRKISDSEFYYLPFEVTTDPGLYVNPEYYLSSELTFDNADDNIFNLRTTQKTLSETLESKKNSLEKKSKQGDKEIVHQISIIEKIINNLSDLTSLQKNEFTEEDNEFIKTLNLITIKPMLYICNVDEESVQNGNELSKKVNEHAIKNNHNSVIVSASIESQIAELEDNDEKLEMIKEMGLNDTTLSKVIKGGYNLLDLINYFTCGPKETRSWTINKNTMAPQAAGKIHTDFEKGFIRAETIAYNDFVEFNGESGSRDNGKLRQEGKDYTVKNGDVMHFLFNV